MALSPSSIYRTANKMGSSISKIGMAPNSSGIPSALGGTSEIILSSDQLNSAPNGILVSPIASGNKLQQQLQQSTSGAVINQVPNIAAAANNPSSFHLAYAAKQPSHTQPSLQSSAGLSNVVLTNNPHGINSLYIQSPQHFTSGPPDKQSPMTSNRNNATAAVILTPGGAGDTGSQILASPGGSNLVSATSLTLLNHPNPQSQHLHQQNTQSHHQLLTGATLGPALAANNPGSATSGYLLAQCGPAAGAASNQGAATYAIDPSSATALYLLEATGAGTPPGLSLKPPTITHHPHASAAGSK